MENSGTVICKHKLFQYYTVIKTKGRRAVHE